MSKAFLSFNNNPYFPSMQSCKLYQELSYKVSLAIIL